MQAIRTKPGNIGHFAQAKTAVFDNETAALQASLVDPEKQKEIDREYDKKQILKMVIQSNLISGGMEERHLSSISDPTKEKMIGLAGLIQDKKLIEALNGMEDTMESLNDPVLNAIIIDGEDDEVDYVIGLLQAALEQRRPPVTYARLGGMNGLKLSRAAFAVMLKFSDVLDDFVALKDEVTT